MTLLADIIGSGPQLFTMDGRPGSENFTVHEDGTDNKTVSNLLTVDVTISEQYDREAEVTRHPVERGIDVVDHRRMKPRMIKMSGVVSDSPSLLEVLQGNTVGISADSAFGSESRSQKAHRKLNTLFEQADVITVVTAREVYKNMVVASFSERKNDAGEYLGFDLVLEEIRFATTGFAEVSAVAPDVAPSAAKKPRARKPPNPIPGVDLLRVVDGLFFGGG